MPSCQLDGCIPKSFSILEQSITENAGLLAAVGKSEVLIGFTLMGVRIF